MTRVSAAPGGASSIVFGEETKPVALAANSTEAAAAPQPADGPVPAAVCSTAEEQLTVDQLKLNVISTVSRLTTSNSEIQALVSDFIKKLEDTGAVARSTAVSAEASLELLKAALKARGTHGIVSLGKRFKSMDDDGNNKISFEEWHKALKEMSLPEADVHKLFRHFDADCSGFLSLDELLVGLRGTLNARRLDMVQRAFKVLDKTGDGSVTLDDVKKRYNASRHPDVLLGTKSNDQVLAEFLSTFEASGGGTKGDGVVTFEEFKKYYEAVSASIDLDDYFELAIRNAWHISGGEGWCANTTCKRVLVLHEDGHQSVQEIKDDLDVTEDQYLAKLKEQGITDAKSVALYGAPDDAPAAKPAELAPPPSPSTASVGTPTSGTPTGGRFGASAGKKGGADHFRSSIIFG